jgi:hypothetical protein
MNAENNCSNCTYVAYDKATRCPQCGSWMRKARRIRRLGWVLIFLGLLLVVMMVTITAVVAPIMLSTGGRESTTHFTGTSQQAMLILGLFALITVFGVVCIANGIWQIFTGRRNIWIMVIVFALAFLLIVVAEATNGALDHKKSSGRLIEIASQNELTT